MPDPTDSPAELNELRGEAAALIRSHLWRSKTPPTPGPTGHKPWHMGRELSMWNALVREGNDPEAINGAITKVRDLTGISGPMTLHIFYSNGGKTRPIFEQCKGRWLAEEKNQPKRFRDVLREIADG